MELIKLPIDTTTVRGKREHEEIIEFIIEGGSKMVIYENSAFHRYMFECEARRFRFPFDIEIMEPDEMGSIDINTVFINGEPFLMNYE